MSLLRNYLRVRGEYLSSLFRFGGNQELPPRTRRIPQNHGTRPQTRGTTSAYAENTTIITRNDDVAWNYLRVRGEYNLVARKRITQMELPPRTRRILILTFPVRGQPGTTSAYAENTHAECHPCGFSGNYLRVRGEYHPGIIFDCATSELPPRTRRIRQGITYRGHWLGTTSAYAENTPNHLRLSTPRGNYLRVRGEYPK